MVDVLSSLFSSPYGHSSFLEKVKTEQKQYAPIILGHKYTGNKEQFLHPDIHIFNIYLEQLNLQSPKWKKHM